MPRRSVCSRPPPGTPRTSGGSSRSGSSPSGRPKPTLLDVGAGSGKVAERLAPHFGSLTLLEPNPNQIAGFTLDKAKVLLEPLENYHSSEQYELVVCSHVLRIG